jgi:penicillin-binding protein 2
MTPFRVPEHKSGTYDRRLKVFIGLSLALFLMCLLRLLQIQLLADASLQDEIAALKERRNSSRQLQTLRGKILDRHGETIAANVPRFQVYINYRLSCFLDERVVQARLLEAQEADANPSLYDVYNEVDDKRQDLELIIEKCARFGLSREQVEEKIRRLNDAIWDYRSFIAWVRDGVDPNLVAKYGGINSIPTSEGLAGLERRFPDPNERYRRVARVDDIPRMEENLALVELQTEDDVFAAQLGFMGMNDVQILPTGHRYYPRGAAAAQTIGYVQPATQKRDTKLFADDPLASYLAGEVCGREDGVEYVCESILRGRRGELVYDIDRQLIRQTETQFGRDVRLTLDISLQERIEKHLSDPQTNPDYCKAPMAAVVIQIGSGDILALVSLPNYDLNYARYAFNRLRDDPNRPLLNRTINHQIYPPGSVAKPLVLIAGLESGVVTPEEPISCPAARAPAGWPNCLIYLRHKRGHDGNWLNNARNAIKGSCNIYFSHVADRVEARELQRWLFNFGYGREIPLLCPAAPVPGSAPRSFKQFPGQIGGTLVSPHADIKSLDQIPALSRRDKIMFGIGQGNFRVTPLQVANAFAALARGGRYSTPNLFLEPRPLQPAPVDLKLSPTTLRVVYDGMSAVVNERGGTAYDAFVTSGLSRQGVKVYGKTGSTERPDHAWFAGFAEDHEGAKIAIALVVEGGQHGSSDAGPLARDIIRLCVEAGYVGRGTSAMTGAR